MIEKTGIVKSNVMTTLYYTIATVAAATWFIVAVTPGSLPEGFFVVRDVARANCEISIVKPRRPGLTILGDLTFRHQADAIAWAKQHCPGSSQILGAGVDHAR